MRSLLPILIVPLLLSAGCRVAEQPEGDETVAAFEVPLLTTGDRRAFLTLLSDVAKTEGHHVDAVTGDRLERITDSIPEGGQTVSAVVWRGTEDDETLALVMDGYRQEFVWILFQKGEDRVLSARFQKRAVQRIKARWPDTLSIPIMADGAVPLRRELIRTREGYIASADGIRSNGADLTVSNAGEPAP